MDWVNILAYNVHNDVARAEAFYENAISETFPKWISKIGKSKSCFGMCVPAGCAYGPGPDPSVVSEWTEFSKSHGGMMMYTGSADRSNDFEVTNQIITDFQ